MGGLAVGMHAVAVTPCDDVSWVDHVRLCFSPTLILQWLGFLRWAVNPFPLSLSDFESSILDESKRNPSKDRDLPNPRPPDGCGSGGHPLHLGTASAWNRPAARTAAWWKKFPQAPHTAIATCWDSFVWNRSDCFWLLCFVMFCDVPVFLGGTRHGLEALGLDIALCGSSPAVVLQPQLAG